MILYRRTPPSNLLPLLTENTQTTGASVIDVVRHW